MHTISVYRKSEADKLMIAATFVFPGDMTVPFIPMQLWDLNAATTFGYTFPDLNERIPDPILSYIENWAERCISDHSKCPKRVIEQHAPKKSRKFPTRLLDLGCVDATASISLCKGDSLPPDAHYLTLSHCWGKSPAFRLLVANEAELSKHVPYSALPQTFRDAIDFTRALKKRYLWIDAVCIIQDSENDWVNEAIMMDSVYSGSWLNLAATSAKDGNGGLFPTRNPFVRSACLVRPSWEGYSSRTYLSDDRQSWNRRIEKGPLNQRAWVLQERLLAPRTVHFAEDQIWWECVEVRASESFPLGLPPSAKTSYPNPVTTYNNGHRSGNEDVGLLWWHVVIHYSSLKLSRESDKLSAFAGIASAFAHRFDIPVSSYLAGMWRKDLERKLLWHAGGDKKSQLYRAPSWSWASCMGEISSPDVHNYAGQMVKIVKAEVEPVADHLGAVKGGFLILQGPLCRIHFAQLHTTSEDGETRRRLYFDSRGDFLEDFYDYFDEPSFSSWCGADKNLYFCCFYYKETNSVSAGGLILQATKGAPGEYCRVGVLHFYEEHNGIISQGHLYQTPLRTDEYLEKVGGKMYMFKVI